MGLAESILNAKGTPGGPRDLLGEKGEVCVGGSFLILLQAEFR